MTVYVRYYNKLYDIKLLYNILIETLILDNFIVTVSIRKQV